MRILFLGNDPNPLSVACCAALAREGRHEVIVAAGDPGRSYTWRALRGALRDHGVVFVARHVAQMGAAKLALGARRAGLRRAPRALRSLSEVALAHGLRTVECGAVNAEPARARFAALAPDWIVVAGFSQILRRALLAIPASGSLNVHPSLLPAYRGPNPYYWVVARRERETGVTVHWIDEGIDTGDIVAQERVALAEGETERSLALRSSEVAARLLLEALGQLEAGTARRVPQSEEGASRFSHPPRGASKL